MSRKSYVGRDVTISFDPDVCQHSGNCARGLAAVFDTQRRPWIDPDGASAEEVVAQVGKCPSGALRIEPPDADG
ncbi:MAG: (4Fe-4S)-binding protein [Acidimicrobiales bacterium]